MRNSVSGGSAGGEPRLAPSGSFFSKHKLSRQVCLTVASAKDPGIEKVRVSNVDVSRVGGGRGYPGGTEYIAIADGEVLVIEHIVKICPELKIGRFGDLYFLAHRQVHHSKAGRPEAVASQGCFYVGPGDH